MRSTRSGTLALLLLGAAAACERPPEPVDTTLPEEPAAAAGEPGEAAAANVAEAAQPELPAGCVGPGCRTLTVAGWAGIRAGMPVRAAEQASGMRLVRPGHYDEYFADEPDRLAACNIHGLSGAPPNVSVFVEDGIVTSIGADRSDEPGAARFATDRGVGLGDTEQAVRRAYSPLEEEPDIYREPPDKKLFYRTPDGNGIKFSIVGGRVAAINVGGSSINYVEGCL